MKTLITVLDGITETSMPFNEFVLYRGNHFPDERQVLIICGKKKPLPQVTLPQTLRIVYAGRNPLKIRRVIRKEVQQCRQQGEAFAIHMHQVKSAVLSHIALMGTGLGKKTLFTVHSTFPGYSLHNKLESLFAAACSRYVTCVSRTALENYPGFMRKWKGARMTAVQNGVDTERIDALLGDTEEKAGDDVRFLYVARMIPIKNHVFLAQLLPKCDPQVKFIFVGAPDRDGSVQKAIREAGVEDRVIQTGLIPRNQVFAMLSRADGYISSSTLEGLPVSVLEAMYAGLPAVLSRIPQHAEIAGEQTDIVSLLPFEPDRWAEVINAYARMTPEERRSRGRQARQHVAGNFSLIAMHEKYSRIYQEIRENGTRSGENIC